MKTGPAYVVEPWIKSKFYEKKGKKILEPMKTTEENYFITRRLIETW